MTKAFFIAGIGTGVGKTFVSALCVQALHAEYWKPVQSGTDEGSDREWVRNHVSVVSSFHPETYAFRAPLSPHAAAAAEGREISLDQIVIPDHRRTLVIEGAGGVLVPLRSDLLQIDLIARLGTPVLLVVRHYLGSINHTLLSLEALRARGIPLVGLILLGDPLPGTVEALESFGKAPIIAQLPWFDRINKEAVAHCAAQIEEVLRESLGA